MDLDTFERSLAESQPPRELPPLVAALWHEAKGDWEGAHKIAQADESADAAWVHAYLHRVEGDESNAAYWYARAARPASTAPLTEERRQIAAALLART